MPKKNFIKGFYAGLLLLTGWGQLGDFNILGAILVQLEVQRKT